MRLVIARCTVDYVGRLTAHLSSATRLLLVKADGSVSIHADDRAYKPLNCMTRLRPLRSWEHRSLRGMSGRPLVCFGRYM